MSTSVCPFQTPGPFTYPPATWQLRGELLHCSFCGSLHNEVFLKHLREVIENPDPDFRVELNDRREKVYTHWPDDDGKDVQLKFYLAHLKAWCEANEISIDEIDARLHAAFKVSEEKWSIIAAIFEQKLKL
jgi:hypothetical protein